MKVTSLPTSRTMPTSNAASTPTILPRSLEGPDGKAPHDPATDVPASTRPTGTSFAHGLPTPTSPKPQTYLSSFIPDAYQGDPSAICDDAVSHIRVDCDADESHMKPRAPTPAPLRARRAVHWSGPRDRTPEPLLHANTWPLSNGRKSRGYAFCHWDYQDQKRVFHMHMFEGNCCPSDELGDGYTSSS